MLQVEKKRVFQYLYKLWRKCSLFEKKENKLIFHIYTKIVISQEILQLETYFFQILEHKKYLQNSIKVNPI